MVSLDIGSIPEDMQRLFINYSRCKFLAVGLSNDTVKLLTLDPETCLQCFGTQALKATPERYDLKYIISIEKNYLINNEIN